MLQRSILSILLGVFLFLATGPDCESAELNSAQQAIEAANRILGLEPRTGQVSLSVESAEAARFVDSTTPFLGEHALGRTAWVITKRNAVTVDRAGNRLDWGGTLTVYIDSSDGTLLKAVCDIAELNPKVDLQSSAKHAEEDLRGTGEVYEGFPTVESSISLVQAAKACPENPLKAKQVIVQYVMLKKGQRGPRPVWIFTLRGLSPEYPARGEWIPVYQLNHVRVVVDAITGKPLFSSTFPNVPLTKEDRARLFPHLRDSE